MASRYSGSQPVDAVARRDVLIAASAVGCFAVAALVPVSTMESGPVVCPLRLLTGVECPGCGLARSWTSFAHGDVAASIAWHPFGIVMFFAAIAAVVAVVRREIIGGPPVAIERWLTHPVALAVLAAWLAWWIVA